jgi:hypothetical protein
MVQLTLDLVVLAMAMLCRYVLQCTLVASTLKPPILLVVGQNAYGS